MRTSFSVAAWLFVVAFNSAGDGAPKIDPNARPEPFEFTVAGEFAASDARNPNTGAPGKVHAVRLQKNQAYVIELKTEGATPFVFVSDSVGNFLVQGAHRGNNIARIRFVAPKDDIFLFHASAYGGGGKYAFSVKLPSQSAVNVVQLAAPAVNKPSEIQGRLADDDPPDQYRDFPAKVHTVDLKAGKRYVIDLMSKQFDTYLLLQDANAATIAQDDDGGGSLNSRIQFQPRVDGRYRVVATTFNGQVGPFTLRVAEQP